MDRRRGAAFTLIELLVVMIIIAIIIAITLPALRSIRATTRKSATEAMLRQITNAAAVFQTDNRRLPGYFTAKQMGSATNGSNSSSGAGFVEMQNVLLDLSGFQSGGTTVRVGPDPNGNAYVDLDVSTLGVPGPGNNKAYWLPDGKHLQAQNEAGQQDSNHAPNTTLPTVIDHFRNPILAWVADDAEGGAIKTLDEFARMDSSSPARFYWASNAGLLRATAFGRGAIDQAAGSLLGSGVSSAQNLQRSMAGVLGDPNWPYKNPSNPTMPSEIPSRPRAPFMVHSAGADGLFAGKKDGAEVAGAGYIDYRYNSAPNVTQPIGSGNNWADKDDKATNIDLMSRFFDDVLVGGGN